jgi:tetratricopeptide (TPR) repeat protein
MKRGQGIFLVGLLAILLAGIFWWYGKKESSAPSPAKLSKKVQHSALPKKRADTRLTAEEIKTVADCAAYWKSLQTINLNSPVDEKGLGIIADSKGCEPSDSQLALFQSAMRKSCGIWESTQKERPKAAVTKLASSTCRLALAKYVSTMVDLQTRNIPLHQITDKRILANKIYSKLTSEYQEALEASERLLALDPKNKAAAKAAAIAQLQLLSSSIRNPASEVSFDDFDRALQRVKEVASDDSYFIREMEISALILEGGNTKALQAEIDKFRKDYPTKGQPLYYSAFIKASNGDGEAAKASLQEAAKLEPGKLMYIATSYRLSKAKTPLEMKQSFGMNFSFEPKVLLDQSP